MRCMADKIYMNTDLEECLDRQKKLANQFIACATEAEKYQKIMQFGKSLPLLDSSFRTEANLVRGCQSVVYLSAFSDDAGKANFQIYSEALISSGLAALLFYVYNKLSPTVILQCPPDFIKDLNLYSSLSPGRSNGLASIFLHMKQRALKLIIESNNQL